MAERSRRSRHSVAGRSAGRANESADDEDNAMNWHAYIFAVLVATTLYAQTPQPAILKDVGIDQKLGVQLPADLTFTDDAGKTVRLGDYFGKRPIILSLVYYQCPMLCTMSLNDLTRAMGAMPLDP